MAGAAPLCSRGSALSSAGTGKPCVPHRQTTRPGTGRRSKYERRRKRGLLDLPAARICRLDWQIGRFVDTPRDNDNLKYDLRI
jgi:hypothetical protein